MRLKLRSFGDVKTLTVHIIEVLNLANVLLNDIINNGYKRAEFFNVEAIVKQYQSVFEAVLQ